MYGVIPYKVLYFTTVLFNFIVQMLTEIYSGINHNFSFA